MASKYKDSDLYGQAAAHHLARECFNDSRVVAACVRKDPRDVGNTKVHEP
jgi:hypothetical protein